ncbi:MAG: AAA family ATPase [bacterium]
MRLTAFTVTGYRTFAEPTRIELRPITLLYGRNNAGKSALLRLLPLLGDSVADTADSPLTLSGPAGRDSTYLDLPWQGQTHKRLTITLEWVDGDQRITDAIEFDHQDGPGVYVRSIRTTGPHAFKATSIEFGSGRYTLSAGGDASELRLDFEGLLPQARVQHPPLVALRDRLVTLRQTITWLMASRVRPRKLIERTGARPRLGHDGANADAILVAQKEVLDDVARWYARPELARTLSTVEVNHPFHRLKLNPANAAGFDVNLKDTGEGMTQVLPVLVAAAQARLTSGPRFLAIEEPESHLHADAQHALASHLAELAAIDDPPIILLETHSRLLMLGFQLAVAGGVPPDKLIAYWVDQEANGSGSAQPVTFSDHGHIDGWPALAMSEDRVLARRLVSAQIGRERAGRG